MFRNFRGPIAVSLLLTFSIIEPLSSIGVAQQQPQRERRVAPTASPTPSPTPSEIPAATPGPPQQVQPGRQQRPTTFTTRTTAELQARISEILRRPELAPAMIGIKVASLDTGKVLFEQNANKLLSPASNMKLYTVAAGLDRLSPDYHFVTSVYAVAKPDASGIVHGDLTIYGRGDPSIAARFNGDYFKGIDDLAARIAAAGVKQVAGDLVGDESYFSGPAYGSGWQWEDLQWGFGAEVSALSINDNLVNLSISPGRQVGASVVVSAEPSDPLLAINNHATTTAKGTRRNLLVHRGLDSDMVEVQGSMALDDAGFSGRLGVAHPALLFVYLLRSSLAKKGVIVSGKTRTIAPSLSVVPANTNAATGLVELTNLQSPPFSMIAASTLKPSQNLYAELILRTLGRVAASSSPNLSDIARTSESNGVEVVRAFLREAGVDASSLSLTDGSGLSRDDMVTAEATLQLLTYMRRHRYANAFREALPIAGVDGTIRNRMKGTPAQNNLRAKTGELQSASSLSGFVVTASGEELVFSIMVNNYPDGVNPPSVCIDPIAVLLASFAGHS
ncbi:MAG: D-alanyl-D-alanine carboxypeptidase/D-alanyl-D-alanine-endopeptidase [Blastocatellia bacterium]|nr:D-alanyl-D-alanine carboxypeptidase/D-alanyl-D-alanine-endopeptidase [Blastocatellia bacterium]